MPDREGRKQSRQEAGAWSGPGGARAAAAGVAEEVTSQRLIPGVAGESLSRMRNSWIQDSTALLQFRNLSSQAENSVLKDWAFRTYNPQNRRKY